ncbi:UDP-N-acetylmuramoyl-L-alanine--D-glutamate ligase [Nonomuraea sp. NPDC023979]|uniref:UDP-N-acetylmuramoyl-L-alanine--D-glutamate ligase n=1 Tax=Nonomuraea sp. NPDC023979 TaxID=3154796 RepID=UPI0033E034CE
MLLHHARILIIGLGVSGEAAALWCASRGASVTVTDTRSHDDLAPALKRLSHLPISYHLGTPPPAPETYTLIVRSPGVPRELPLLLEAHRRGVPVWSEMELGWAACPRPITAAAITGTNGKSTTTVLLGDLMRAAGRTTHVAGNIGHPLTAAAPGIQAGDCVVIEVSSAQLEDCHSFAPRVAVLTNIRPEHMDHYTWQQYVAAKARIVRNHTPAHATIANYDDPMCRQIAESTPGRTIFFSTAGPLPHGAEGVFCDGSDIVARYDGSRMVVCARAELRLPGVLPNLMAMMAAGLVEDIPAEVIRQVAVTYAGREHVIEHVATAAAVDYYNDSKATNPWSTLHAVDSFADRPVVLITGGKDDKDADLTALAEALPGRVRHLITMGQTGRRTAEAARRAGLTAVTEADSLAEAVDQAYRVALPGDVVLFSPGANSKDMFSDHRARGHAFKRQARDLLARDRALHPAGR